MPDLISADLTHFPRIGEIRLLRAEWNVPKPTFVLIRYALGDGEEEPLGFRLDLDKRAIIDDPGTTKPLRDLAPEIAEAVARVAYPEDRDA